MQKIVVSVAAVIACGLLPGAAEAQTRKAGPTLAEALRILNSDARPACSALTGSRAPVGLKIVSAAPVAAAAAGTIGEGPLKNSSALPAHCLVKGVINERTNSAGKTYGIRFELALPDDWSGRFLMMGGGGLNGSIRPPWGPVAAGVTPALSRGFAVVSHDSGHKGAGFDPSFSADQRAALDFAETSVFTVTIIAKAITEAFYGNPIARSYMTGCSTGGREGMLAIQRYPELFDGVVIGAPAMRTGDSNLAIEKGAVDFNRAAPLGADGKPDVTRIFSDADRATIKAGILNQCDGLDGLQDGVIENLAQCRFDATKLTCRPGRTEGCLSAKQSDALAKGFQPPVDAGGRALYTRFPYDSGVTDPQGGYIPSGRPGPFGPPSTALTIDVDARIAEVRADAMQRLTDTSYWTNLNTFLDRGGKTIFYHGVSDFWFSPFATWDWWERAAQTNGKAFTDASRMYMVPGMFHCRGGDSFDNFDLLGEVVDWVERGEAPDRPIASRADGSASRPLCQYPAYPHYTGGDATRPESFQCRVGT